MNRCTSIGKRIFSTLGNHFGASSMPLLNCISRSVSECFVMSAFIMKLMLVLKPHHLMKSRYILHRLPVQDKQSHLSLPILYEKVFIFELSFTIFSIDFIHELRWMMIFFFSYYNLLEVLTVTDIFDSCFPESIHVIQSFFIWIAHDGSDSAIFEIALL